MKKMFRCLSITAKKKEQGLIIALNSLYNQTFLWTWKNTNTQFRIFSYTVKYVYKSHPRDPKVIAVVNRWSLFRGLFKSKKLKIGHKKAGGGYSEVAGGNISLTFHNENCEKKSFSFNRNI